MTRASIRWLRVVLVVLFAIALFAQVIIPFAGYQFVTESFPEVHYLLVPYCLAAILAFACVEVCLVAIWKLLSMVRREQIFTERAFSWVNILIAGPAIAAALVALVAAHMLIVNIGSTAPVGLLGLVALGVGMSLLMVVMRGLLKTATGYRAELNEVI